MPIDHGATESRKRILHWSKRWFGGMSTVVVAAVWLTFLETPVNGRVVWLVILSLIEVMMIRGLFGGAIRRKEHLLIRNPVWTRRIRWSEIHNIELAQRNHATILAVHLVGGQTRFIWGSDGGFGFPASSSWKADSLQDLRNWVSTFRRA